MAFWPHLLFVCSLMLPVLAVERKCDDGSDKYAVTFLQNKEEYGYIEIVVASAKNGNGVRVTTPARNDTRSFDETKTIGPAIGTFRVSHSLRNKGVEKSNKGILIEADSSGLFVSYGINNENGSCDGFLALPTMLLGTEYYPLVYWPPLQASQIGIVAIEDDTEVEISLPQGQGIGFTYKGVVYGDGSTVLERLDSFETLQIQDYNDLTGTRINSSKPIGVFSGNIMPIVNNNIRGRRGHLIIQNPPVNIWGKMHFVTPAPNRPDTIIKLVAATKDTNVTVTPSVGAPTEWRAQKDGDFLHLVESDQVLITLESDLPIEVVQFIESKLSRGPLPPTDSQSPAMTIVPAVEHYKPSYFFTTPAPSPYTPSNHYALLTVPKTKAGGLRLDGLPLNVSGWTDFPVATPPMVGAVIDITPGPHQMEHVDGDVFFGAVLYGSSTSTCTYAYPAGICWHHEDRDECSCPTLFVTGPSSHKERVGLYYIESCQVAEHPVWKHADGQTFLYYNDTESTWVFSEVLASDTAPRLIQSNTDLDSPDDSEARWSLRNLTDGQWVDAPTVSVQCACNRSLCHRLVINSTDIDHSFPGEFIYIDMVNGRPAYDNTEQDVFLYFREGPSCNFWGVAPELNSTLWLMHAYDISPMPQDIRAPFQVSSADDGWQEDPDVRVFCVD